MKITERDIKIWSSIGTRATIEIVALELDKLHNTRTHGVPKSFAALAKELGVFDFLL